MLRWKKNSMLQIQNFLAGLLIPRETLTLPECQWEQSHVRQREGQRASFPVPGREGISHPSTHFESEIRAARKERCSVPEQLTWTSTALHWTPQNYFFWLNFPFWLIPRRKFYSKPVQLQGIWLLGFLSKRVQILSHWNARTLLPQPLVCSTLSCLSWVRIKSNFLEQNKQCLRQAPLSLGICKASTGTSGKGKLFESRPAYFSRTGLHPHRLAHLHQHAAILLWGRSAEKGQDFALQLLLALKVWLCETPFRLATRSMNLLIDWIYFF